MAIIPTFFFDAVVAIGVEAEENINWIGTGFLVGRQASAPNKYTIFLVTNHHIIENKTQIVVRFNQENTDVCKDYFISVVNKNGNNYSKHPNADVIAIQISPSVLDDNHSEYSWFSLDKHALDIKQMKETDVIEGSIVYSLGFPLNMIGLNRKTPVCRIGCISRISDLFNDLHVNEYLIDLQAIPGNSGAPVINRPETISIEGTAHNASANLIGIISGTIDYSEKCEGGTCGLAYERNSGFATVHPVDTIKDVVEQEYQRGRESQ